MKKFQTFHSSYCVSRSYFSEDESQNDLIFQPVLSYLRRHHKISQYFNRF